MFCGLFIFYLAEVVTNLINGDVVEKFACNNNVAFSFIVKSPLQEIIAALLLVCITENLLFSSNNILDA